MSIFDRRVLSQLLETRQEPCVSICMPTHRRFPESNQDPIKFGNLVKDVSAALEKKDGKRDEKAAALLSDDPAGEALPVENR